MAGHTDVANGLDLNSLLPGSFIDVETKSRRYRIECLGGSAIRISGHPEYCPRPVRAQLEGAIDKQGIVELGLIGRGKRLLFFLEGRGPVTTSRVVSVQVEGPAEASPVTSPHVQ